MLALLAAAFRGGLADLKRLVADGASVTERDTTNGFTALVYASSQGNIAVVKYLLEEGASITEKTDSGWTSLLVAAAQQHYPLVEYLLQETESCIDETLEDSLSVWNLLEPRGADEAELSSLLKVMVMLDGAPHFFVAKLSPVHVELITRGRQYRAQLPSYLEQQRALVVAHCPLPSVLQPLVAAYAATTPEDMWTEGLRVRIPRVKRLRATAGAEEEENKGAAMPLRRSLRLRQKRA
jgi:hypothetical protein